MALVKTDKLADALNITRRRIELVHEGMPREGRGRYDLGKCLLCYIRYLQKVIEARGAEMSDAEFGSLKTERLALMRVHRELREIELAKARKQFVAIEDREKAFGNKALTIKARLMGIPACLAAELVGQKSRVAI